MSALISTTTPASCSRHPVTRRPSEEEEGRRIRRKKRPSYLPVEPGAGGMVMEGVCGKSPGSVD